jgi:hypothetical protein
LLSILGQVSVENQKMTALEIFEHDGELVVDSRLIAERLGIEHRSFLETVENYRTQVEQAFGVLRFETAKPTSPQGNIHSSKRRSSDLSYDPQQKHK